MSIDEPFMMLGRKPVPALDDDVRRAVDSVRKVGALYSVSDKRGRLRVVQQPDNQPLKMNRRWPLERRIRYCRGRQANALQLYTVKDYLGIGTLADAINVQRMFESLDYQPPRNWRYYPVVDKLLGLGVPRSQPHLPMLNNAQIAIERESGELAIFEARVGIIHFISRR